MHNRRLDFFISRRVRATRYTTTCFRRLPPLLYQMQRRRNPPCAAACSIESFLFRQLVRQATFHESIPLGARKTPDYQAKVHKLCWNGRPEATLCKTTTVRNFRDVRTSKVRNFSPVLKSILEKPRGMASTRRHSAAVIDIGADKDPLANGFAGYWYA
jgi:hypothetical protein